MECRHAGEKKLRFKHTNAADNAHNPSTSVIVEISHRESHGDGRSSTSEEGVYPDSWQRLYIACAGWEHAGAESWAGFEGELEVDGENDVVRRSWVSAW